MCHSEDYKVDWEKLAGQNLQHFVDKIPEKMQEALNGTLNSAWCGEHSISRENDGGVKLSKATAKWIADRLSSENITSSEQK